MFSLGSKGLSSDYSGLLGTRFEYISFIVSFIKKMGLIDRIKNILAFIASIFLIIWGSFQLGYIIIGSNSNNSTNNGCGFLFIGLIKIIILIILFIPGLIYELVHKIFFSTDPEHDASSMFYIILTIVLIWVILTLIKIGVNFYNTKSKETKKKITEKTMSHKMHNNSASKDYVNSKFNKYMPSKNLSNKLDSKIYINYKLPIKSYVTVKIYDEFLQEIDTVVNEEKPSGNYKLNFNTSDFISGTYFYKIQTTTFVETKKFVVVGKRKK